MFCIYSGIISKFIFIMGKVFFLYLFCNNLEIHSYHEEGGCFLSIL